MVAMGIKDMRILRKAEGEKGDRGLGHYLGQGGVSTETHPGCTGESLGSRNSMWMETQAWSQRRGQ